MGVLKNLVMTRNSNILFFVVLFSFLNTGSFAAETSSKLYNNDLIPDEKTCGQGLYVDRILSGENTELGEFPWLVLLEYRKPVEIGTHCGGSLITSRYVLTAAHCIVGRSIPKTWKLYSVRLGEWDTTTDPDCFRGEYCAPPAISVRIESYKTNDKFDPNTQIHDIALLRLAQNIEFTDYISPICLPGINQDVQRISLIDEELYVAGWGKTENRSSSNVLLRLRVPVVSNVKCISKFAEEGVLVGPKQMCAGGVKNQDTCRGDSGGPLMKEYTENKENHWYIMGIVSFGPSPCGLEEWPGVYTRVAGYSKWISENIVA